VNANEVIVLKNGNLEVEIAVNPTNLIQQYGPRFDNTAYVSSIILNGNEFLKSGDGLVDEFGLSGYGVLGYNPSDMGGSFIKIGVGEIICDINEPYQFWHKYPLKDMWPIHANSCTNKVIVSQAGKVINGYGYNYQKTYEIDSNSSLLTIEYNLENIGSKPIEFEQYNHNWFHFSNRPIGPEYSLKTSFDIATVKGLPQWLKSNDGVLCFSDVVNKPIHFPTDIKAGSKLNSITIFNKYTGQAVEVGGDFNIYRFALYAQPDAVCPEVFKKGVIEPSQFLRWTRTYKFKSELK
jgi:hypothetical protein